MASDKCRLGKLTKCNAVEEYTYSTTLAGPAATSGTRTLRFGLESQLPELLPGIPNDVTLNHITTKLPWTDSHVLPSLSRAWNVATRSRQVHCARVRSHSTETVIVIRFVNVIALYSRRGKTFYFLPSIPGVDEGIPSGCQCVCLDDRVYIMGGLTKKQGRPYFALDNRVYVLELVGQRRWRRCANMPQPRVEFGCSIVDGKIYVFGGIDKRKLISGSLVYDPKVNTWSPIAPMPSLYASHDVAVVGGEMFVHSGEVFESDSDEDEVDFGHDIAPKKLVLDVYNPIRNDWRKMETAAKSRDILEVVFVADGEFYVMTPSTIQRHDIEKNSWTQLHSFSCDVLGPVGSIVIQPNVVLVANGELLASVWWFKTSNFMSGGSCLLQSRGFGRENNVIEWEKVTCPLDSRRFSICSMCPVQL